MSKIEVTLVGIIIILGGVGLGGWKYVSHQDQLKKQEIATQQVEQIQQAADQAQAEEDQQQQADQQKATAQQNLNNCINNVDNQTNNAAQQAADTPTTPEAGAITEESIVQVQQSYVAQCQAEYPQ